MKRMAWLLLVAAGAIIALPLGWLSFAMILFAPGFAALSIAKKELTVSELAGLSATLSVLLLPLAVLLSSPISVFYAGLLLGVLTAATGIYHLARDTRLRIDFRDWPVLALAVPVLMIVLLVTMKTFILDDNGLTLATTHASDLNLHLSIAQRFIVSPALPPEDPYLPGYPIVYNWFMHVAMGGITLLSGVRLFDSFKVLVALVSSLIFIDACLLARIAFGDFKASVVAGVIYVASSGLSWLYMLYTWLQGREIDLFRAVIYEWKGIMVLKYDSPSLYFFLPQTQTFGLLAMISGILLYILSVRERSAALAVITGAVLGSMVLYHTITAFPALVALGLTFLYLIYHERRRLFRPEGYGLIAIAAVPLVLAGVAAMYQWAILSASAGQQVVPGYQGDVPQTIVMALGPLVPFALYGMYRMKDKLAAVPLLIFAAVNFLFLNILQMPATWNTYRFLVFLGLPVSLFAGLVLSGWLFSGKRWKAVIVVLVILAMVPSTAAIVLFYSDSSYVHATPADVKALAWVRDNTPADAIFFEEPTHFVRLPVLTGRDVAYAGNVYTWQYHNVDRQPEMEAILHTTDREQLYAELVKNRVDYVFVGSREAGYPFAVVLNGMDKVRPVYDRDGVRIYQVSHA
ncbi:MAG: hypothetical protein A4E28_02619 [Methanocella sp. PtaU1.Bin125]|nr:MAG: hypothetical protein A4E28_02619 [Methanocella sp. PtaU1.Bin125]